MRQLTLLLVAVGCGSSAPAAVDAQHLSGTGSIEVRSFGSAMSGAGTEARGLFVARDDCGTVQVGPCSIRACEPDWYGLAVSAGKLAIDSTPPFAMGPYPSDNYVFYTGSSDQPAFAPGEMRSLSATGDAVPAFSTSLVAPMPAVVTAPNAALTIGSGDLQIAWQGGSGFLEVDFTATLRRARCRFDASLGAGVIPADALYREPGETFTFETSNDSVTTVNDWTVTTTASIGAAWLDGSAATGTITITP